MQRATAKRAMSLALYNHKTLRGSYQTNLHVMQRGIKVMMKSPMCFHVNTPRQGESLYQFREVGATTPPVYAPTPTGNFTLPTSQQTTVGDPAAAGMPEHDFWQECNDDKINGKYYLQTMNLTVSVRSVFDQAAKITYRIDFVKPNRGAMFRAIQGSLPLGIDAANFKLPDALGSFNGILGVFNRVNPMYWTFTRKPIYFTVGPGGLAGVETDAAGPNTKSTESSVYRHIHMKINKLFNPRDIGTTGAEASSAYLTIPDNEQEWCVISNDYNYYELDAARCPDVYVTRQFSWRDRVGHAV